MPLPKIREAPRRPERNVFGDPLPPPYDPDLNPTPPDAIDLHDRQAELRAVRAERSRLSNLALDREVAAMKPTDHPCRKFRLQYPSGPLTQADLSLLSGASVRSIQRLENGEPVTDLVIAAVAAALIDPSLPGRRPARVDQIARPWKRT